MFLLVATSVTLAWDPSAEAVSYRLYAGILPGESIQWYPTTITSYEVMGLDFGTKYYFRATAFNAAGLESDYSNEVQFTPMPSPAPTATPTLDDNPGLNKGWFK